MSKAVGTRRIPIPSLVCKSSNMKESSMGKRMKEIFYWVVVSSFLQRRLSVQKLPLEGIVSPEHTAKKG